MKLNLRILIYLNPSNIHKTTHKFNLQSDSGFILVKNSILALNKKEDWHYYLLVPEECFDNCWIDKPKNVTLIKYPYVNDALNSRFHFDTNSLKKSFNNYSQDIDFVWTMLPEHAGSLKAFCNKRREEVPIFSYINWLDYSKTEHYAPSFIFRLLDGIHNSDIVGIQSNHMLNFMKNQIIKEFNVDYNKIKIIHPKACFPTLNSTIGNTIGFPHRISTESGFFKMLEMCENELLYKIWVTNLNSVPIKNKNVISKHFENYNEYIEELSKIRFGISYHVGYSMWSMSVVDMMGVGKVVLVPKKNAFPEIFDKDYPFFFEDKNQFLMKLNYLQRCPDEILLKWGNRNREIIKENFTWEKQAEELSNLFYEKISLKKNKKTQSVLSKIKDYEIITKQDLINKNITDFSRQCSRSWNKVRIELMRDYNIKDDMTKDKTTFYVNGYDLKKGILKRPEKINTPWYEKNFKISIDK